jgi:AmmeMemoRadiSam system protein B/AmmeMemoRadiSam system protein A
MYLQRLVVLAVFSLLALGFPAGCAGQIKEPAVAGAFYPGDPVQLKKVVDGYLGSVKTVPVEGKLLALMVPHAGYEFSGQVAAYAYSRLKGSDIDTVILVGPSHHGSFSGAAVYTGTGMRTPLGTVRVNEKIARELLNEKAGVKSDPAPFAKEHSLEVQLPFLQRTLKEFTVVPVLIGAPTRESYAALAQQLTTVLKGNPRALLVISTDLSHYHDKGTAGIKDGKVLDAAARLSAADLERLFTSGEGEMCGGFPLLYGMATIRNLGGTNGVLFRQADSGDANGERQRVVGYGAMGFYRTPLTAAQKSELLSMARESMIARVVGMKFAERVTDDPRLKADGAVFVTLKEKNGNLRGCIGNIIPVMPLYRSVIQNAVAASTMDRRFPPVKPAELPNLEVEVTVLSPLEPLGDVQEIRIGTDGLYLEAGNSSSVFLPQVPVEQGWTRETYLAELAMKAGLPKDGWKNGKLHRFTAEIIH